MNWQLLAQGPAFPPYTGGGAGSQPLGTIGGEGFGPFGNIEGLSGTGVGGGTTALIKVTGAISSVIGIMTVAAGIWFLFQFLIGGFFWMSSAGDKTKLHEARERITNAFVGLLIVVAGWSILALAGQFFGFDIVIGNPAEIIGNLGIQ
ncbi:hypothetical protein HY410_01865 [Candidatus Gottesmanbacteria bacterium]|nr:hypothetical protein [Candidatus Gottesmanbacteria bacterium]